MRQLFLGIAALAGALLLSPFAAAQTISMPMQLRTGDVFTVSVDYTQSADMGDQELSATMSYAYSVHVLDAEQRLWRFMPVSVSYELPEAPGLAAQAANVNWPAASDMLSAMMRVATDVGFECRVDEYGRCLEMTNWPFWSARVENMAIAFDAVARMLPNRPATNAGQGEAPPVEQHRPGKSDDVAAPASATPSTRAAPDWETVRAPVMRGVARRIDRRNNAAIVTHRSRLDQASVRAAIDAMTEFVSDALIEPLAPYFPEGQEPPDATGLAGMINAMLVDFDYESTTRGVVDLASGMARETTTDYTVSARMAGSEQPMAMHGRIVTRVTPAAPDVPRLPRD